MSEQHIYIGIEALTMTTAHKQTLVAALKKLGRQSGLMPATIMHWRTRLDGNAVILEAEFSTDDISLDRMAARLEALYGLSVGGVSYATAQTAYGPVVTFKTGTTSRLRLIAFGGVDADWGTSLQAVRQYLSDNAADWEGGDV